MRPIEDLRRFSITQMNIVWKEDEELRDDLWICVDRYFKRAQILDYVKDKFPQYKWSLRTLICRLTSFKVNNIDCEASLADVQAAARNKMTRCYFRLFSPAQRNKGSLWPQSTSKFVYNMHEADPMGVKIRGNVIGTYLQGAQEQCPPNDDF